MDESNTPNSAQITVNGRLMFNQCRIIRNIPPPLPEMWHSRVQGTLFSKQMDEYLYPRSEQPSKLGWESTMIGIDIKGPHRSPPFDLQDPSTAISDRVVLLPSHLGAHCQGYTGKT